MGYQKPTDDDIPPLFWSYIQIHRTEQHWEGSNGTTRPRGLCTPPLRLQLSPTCSLYPHLTTIVDLCNRGACSPVTASICDDETRGERACASLNVFAVDDGKQTGCCLRLSTVRRSRSSHSPGVIDHSEWRESSGLHGGMPHERSHPAQAKLPDRD